MLFLSIKCTLWTSEIQQQSTGIGECVYVGHTEGSATVSVSWSASKCLCVYVYVCVCVCVFSLFPSATVNQRTRQSQVNGGGGAAQQSEGVCVCVANKRSLRCRDAAGSRALPERTPCFRQSATAAPCPPH